MREIESSVWLVQFSVPVETASGGTFNRNFDVLIVAPTLERAVEAAREKHSEATMHSVHRRGTSKTVLVVDDA